MSPNKLCNSGHGFEFISTTRTGLCLSSTANFDTFPCTSTSASRLSNSRRGYNGLVMPDFVVQLYTPSMTVLQRPRKVKTFKMRVYAEHVAGVLPPDIWHLLNPHELAFAKHGQGAFHRSHQATFRVPTSPRGSSRASQAIGASSNTSRRNVAVGWSCTNTLL